MKALVVSLAGAAMIASFSPTATLAQGVRVDTPGVDVRIGDPDRRERRDRDERVIIKDRENVGNCRTVTVRKERPDGSSYTHQERQCD